MNDEVSVAVGGRIDRDEVCNICGDGMLFRVEITQPSIARTMFCGNPGCAKWLLEYPTPEHAA